MSEFLMLLEEMLAICYKYGTEMNIYFHARKYRVL